MSSAPIFRRRNRLERGKNQIQPLKREEMHLKECSEGQRECLREAAKQKKIRPKAGGKAAVHNAAMQFGEAITKTPGLRERFHHNGMHGPRFKAKGGSLRLFFRNDLGQHRLLVFRTRELFE